MGPHAQPIKLVGRSSSSTCARRLGDELCDHRPCRLAEVGFGASAVRSSAAVVGGIRPCVLVRGWLLRRTQSTRDRRSTKPASGSPGGEGEGAHGRPDMGCVNLCGHPNARVRLAFRPDRPRTAYTSATSRAVRNFLACRKLSHGRWSRPTQTCSQRGVRIFMTSLVASARAGGGADGSPLKSTLRDARVHGRTTRRAIDRVVGGRIARRDMHERTAGESGRDAVWIELCRQALSRISRETDKKKTSSWGLLQRSSARRS